MIEEHIASPLKEQPVPPREAPRVLLAILAKQKEAVLNFYLNCIEALDYPKASINLYVRTNNNKDRTAEILKAWLDRVGHQYESVFFDDTDAPVAVEQYGVHEWNAARFSVLAPIRQASLQRTLALDCAFYFVVDVDNFIRPGTLKELVALNLPIVGPLLRHESGSHRYSNYHLDIDANGYFKDSPSYDWLLTQQIRGIVQVNVIHCTYLVRADAIAKLHYSDGSDRHEYVIFSATARAAGIPQYLDNRQIYGYLTLEESEVRSRALLGAEVGKRLRQSPGDEGASGSANTYSPNIVANTKFGRLIVNVNDTFIGQEIIQKGYWAEDDIELIRKLLDLRCALQERIVVYDVGANIGTHSLALAAIFGARIRIRAFEAQSSIHKMFCDTMALNGLGNVTCHWNAVSDGNGDSIEIRLPDYNKANNFGGLELLPANRSDNQHMARDGATEMVATVTLDSFDEKVDFIKMDIEGMEHIALEGAKKTITTHRPICFVELFKTQAERVVAFFKARNYVMYRKGADAIFIPAESGLQIQGLQKVF